jgi:hypothetical protein
MNIETKNMNKIITNIVLTIVPKHIKLTEIQQERGTRIIPNQALDDIGNPSEDLLASL